MADAPESGKPQPKILESIIDAAKTAFDPSADAARRESGLQKYNELIDGTQTWILLHALNTLIKPNVLPQWLRTPLMQTLTLLPLRPDGVRATLEFVFAVHPSSAGQTGAESAASQGGRESKGADITHEAVAVATKLLSSVPSSMSPEHWFQGLAQQLFELFDGAAGADVAKTVAQAVGFGILGKRQFGAPGAPGWNAFVQPLLESINPALRSKAQDDFKTSTSSNDDEDVVDLGSDKTLVSQDDLARSLRRLELLIVSNPSPGLCKRVLKPVLLPLWALASWVNPSGDTEKGFCRPSRGLVQTYLRLFGNAESITVFIRDLLYRGSSDEDEHPWTFHLAVPGGIEIIKPGFRGKGLRSELDWGEIDSKSMTLVIFACSMCPAEEISSVFLGLLRRWIQTAGRQSRSGIVISHEGDSGMGGGPDQAVRELIDVTILQKLMEKAPEKLVSHFDQLLELVCQVLQADEQSPVGDDVIGISLSLLNLVITSPTFQKSDVNPPELLIVEESLERIGQGDRDDVSATARNLAMLLRYRDDLEEKPNEAGPALSARHVEDRKTYNLAMSYITGDSENNPPPVVSEGLNLLSGLVIAESPILDIQATMVLMSRLLRENDDFINLRVIKIFTQLANKHPRSTMQELLENYMDSQERLSTDVRLRFGEAILQVMERLGETFSGEVSERAGETLLSIAGRRGHRPKTMAKQARDQRLADLKRRKAEAASSASDMEVDDIDDDDDDGGETAEDRANNAILASILQGWESKRGSEDIRMRTSALSIFGSAVEANIMGVGPTLVSAGVDMSINILTMEPGLETGILRRAAVLLILSFARALEKARSAGQRLGFGLTEQSRQEMQTTLNYVAGTDNDGLVQQHARDVVESLEHWGMSSLLPTQMEREGAAAGLGRLSGLRVSPGGDQSQGGLRILDDQGKPRPRIEEIE